MTSNNTITHSIADHADIDRLAEEIAGWPAVLIDHSPRGFANERRRAALPPLDAIRLLRRLAPRHEQVGGNLRLTISPTSVARARRDAAIADNWLALLGASEDPRS